MRYSLRYAAYCASFALALSSCGGSARSYTQPPQNVAINVQPLSQVIPISQTATFTVIASGTGPLSYQWSKNGTAIPGATSASYTTPAVQLGTNNSTAVGAFQVTVSNAVNSVTSNTASLTVGPRSPKPGDLRYLLFQQVTVPGFWGASGAGSNNINAVGFWYANTLGTPLWLGNVVQGDWPGCGWHFAYYTVPPSTDYFAMFYQEGFLNSTTVAAYLQSVASPNTVITSMDIQPQYPCEVIGVSWVESPENAFDQRLEVISPAQLAAQAASDGQASRIITAASFDGSGNLNLLSYGWTGDTTTVYETQTYIVPAAQVVSTAISLATNGYFISAFGGNDTYGYALVGGRVKGDTLPRPMYIGKLYNATNPGSAYFTPVIELQDNINNPNGVSTGVNEQ